MDQEKETGAPAVSLADLKVEYKTAPIAMDEAAPRFSYRLAGYEAQRWRRIVVEEEGAGVVWDSGVVRDGESIQIPYEGAGLRPFTGYRWSVEVMTDGGGPVLTASSTFETGFLGTGWKGKWIYGRSGIGPYRPAARLAREFAVTKPVRRARLYATALGLYTPYVNGSLVTGDLFTPGWSQYFDHVQYQGYDVTKWLRPGANVLAALVGDGWYCGVISYVEAPADGHGYGTRPLFRANLRIEYEDGETETVATDSSWRSVFLYPALLNNDIYLGEEYDATFDDERWKLPGFERDCSSLGCAEEEPAVRIVWNEGAPVRVVEDRAPVSIRRSPAGAWILDFGVNLTGVERIRLKDAHPGAVVTIRHGEMLDEDGTLYRANLLFAKATTTYTCGRSPGAVYSPRFTYYGFRYLEVSGWPEELTPDSIHALVVSSEMERTGAFRCSNDLVNRLYENAVRGQLGNFLDVPTDCPQRCERFGWTGDAQVFSETAALNFDVPAFFTKWLLDLDASRNLLTGAYPVLAPRPTQGAGDRPGDAGSMGWSDAGIVCPWNLYRFYGDRRILGRLYPGMKAHVDAVLSVKGPLPTIGDHLCVGEKTDLGFTGQALLVELLRIFARIAAVLGRDADAEACRERRAEKLGALRARYFGEDGGLLVRTQTACAMAIVYKLCPDEASLQKVRALLVGEIARAGWHLTTGFLGTPILLRALTEAGEVEAAYRLLEQTTCPSWLYPVTQGATTIWERWNGWTKEDGFFDPEMNSFNHYAFGSVAAWFYRTIAGIGDLTEEGDGNRAYRRFRLAPRVGGSLAHASATLKTPYGPVESAWRRDGGLVDWRFAVPPGTSAEIVFPGEAPGTLPPGVARDAAGLFVARPGEYEFAGLRLHGAARRRQNPTPEEP